MVSTRWKDESKGGLLVHGEIQVVMEWKGIDGRGEYDLMV